MNKKRRIRNIFVVAILLILIDQMLKLYITHSLSLVGQNLSLLGDIIVLYHVSTNMTLLNLGIKILIGIIIVFIARYYLNKNGESKLFLYGLCLLSIGFLGRGFDLITVGQIENIVLRGYALRTVDTLFINFGFFRTFISFSSIVGYVGIFMSIYAMIFNFKDIKSTFSKK